jgi:hypothetical protein
VSLVGAGIALLLAACDQASATGPEAAIRSAPAPRPTVPAADAGGVCRLLDFDGIARTIGVRFDVAASGRQSGTETCLVRSSATALPDLVLTMSPTTADATVFRAEMSPKGARSVKSLGRAAYRASDKAAKGGGPVAEVGWLGTDRRLLTLRYTTPTGTARATADALSARLVVLARLVDFVRS